MFGCLREKAANLGDIYVHEIGGTETHVHLALSIEPTVLISEMIGALKGYTSREVNRRAGLGRKVLEWQTGYGVVSFGTSNLPWVVAMFRTRRNTTLAAPRRSGRSESIATTIASPRLKPEALKPRERGWRQ